MQRGKNFRSTRHGTFLRPVSSVATGSTSVEPRPRRLPATWLRADNTSPQPTAQTILRARSCSITGCVALTRGLALFAALSLRETSLSPRHGLRSNWAEVVNEQRELLDVRISISGRGTYGELGLATGHREMIPVIQSPFPNQTWEVARFSSITSGRDVTLNDVVSRMPSALAVYESSLERRGHSLPAIKWPISGTLTTILIFASPMGLPSEEIIRQELGVPEKTALSPSMTLATLDNVPNMRFQIDHDSSQSDSTVTYRAPWMLSGPRVGTVPIAHSYAVKPVDGDLEFSSLDLLYLTSFALGTLVRYHPTAWSRLSGHGPGDRFFPLVRMLTEIIQNEFPQRIVQGFSLP